MVFGETDTVWLHSPVAEPVAAPASARLPLWTGVVTTLPPAVHVHGDRAVASNPGLTRLFAAVADDPAATIRPPAMTTAEHAAAATRSRFMGVLSGREGAEHVC